MLISSHRLGRTVPDDRLDEIFDSIEASTRRVKGDDVEEATTLPDGAPPRTELFVCDEITADGELCGKAFETSKQLSGHRWGAHRDKTNDSPRGQGRSERSPIDSSAWPVCRRCLAGLAAVIGAAESLI